MATIEERLAALELDVAMLKQLAVRGGAPAPAAAPPAYAPPASREATDAECTGQYGDPEVRKDPPRWDGSSHVGCSYSQCLPEFLDCLADFLEWSVGKDRDNPEAKKHKSGKFFWQFNEKDARLARGWARRIRAGLGPKKEPAPSANGGGGYDYGAANGADEIPFIFDATLTRGGRP